MSAGLRLLADDLTGALDTAAEFAGTAAPLHVFWDGGLPEALPANAAVDSGTRERDRAAACGVVARLAPMLQAGGIAYKKVDSLMRGSTIAELAVCFAAGGWRAGVLAPAFPFQGRVTRQGRQWARRGQEWCAVGPNLVDALLEAGVAAQPGRLGDALPSGISVFDAETDAELTAVARCASEAVLWSGTGGLAGALAGGEAPVSDRLPRPILGLFGTDQAATAAQLGACAPHWHVLDEDAGADRIADALEGGLALLSVALPGGLPRDMAARRIGAALHRVATSVQLPGTVVVAGGETLRALCLALGAQSLRLEGRLVPGLPRSVLVGGAWDGVTVVSKSGAFGPPHLLRNVLAANGFGFEELGR